MAWSYDENLGAKKDEVRLLIGDNLSSQQLLSDEEIEKILDDFNDDIYATASFLCRSLSARFGREATIMVGKTKLDREVHATHFLKLAEKFEDQAGAESVPLLVDANAADSEGYFDRETSL